MHRKPHSFLSSVVCLILCGFAAISVASAEDPNGAASVVSVTSLGQQAAGIDVQTLMPTDLPNQITVPGKIEIIPTMQFDQHAPLSGRIAKIEVEAGQRVTKGQTLAIVESTEMNQLAAQFLQSRLDTLTEFATQQAKLQSEAKQAEDSLHLAEGNLNRLQKLYADKIAAQKDVLQAETDYELAANRAQTAKTSRDIMLKMLKARIKLIQEPIRQRLQIIGVDDKHIKEMLDKQETITEVPIIAARSGILTGIAASAGMSIDPSTNLFTIADLSKVWATAHVYESDMTRMHLGEKVEVKVHALPGTLVPGVLSFIGSQVDPVTRTLPVRCELGNGDGKLKPDMYAELIIQTSESRPVIAIPKDALVNAMSPAGQAVFVQEGQRYKQVRVQTGRELGDRIEVIQGLNAGDNLVVRGAFQLNAQLVKERGGEELFVQPTEGDHEMQDHAVDNKAGSMQVNMPTMVLVIGAAFLIGFAISALLLFKRDTRHECDADEELSLPVVPVESAMKKKTTSES
jgi:cobalt-zinc-cadmium efflux system membrane fusion protein